MRHRILRGQSMWPPQNRRSFQEFPVLPGRGFLKVLGRIFPVVRLHQVQNGRVDRHGQPARLRKKGDARHGQKFLCPYAPHGLEQLRLL